MTIGDYAMSISSKIIAYAAIATMGTSTLMLSGCHYVKRKSSFQKAAKETVDSLVTKTDFWKIGNRDVPVKEKGVKTGKVRIERTESDKSTVTVRFASTKLCDRFSLFSTRGEWAYEQNRLQYPAPGK